MIQKCTPNINLSVRFFFADLLGPLPFTELACAFCLGWLTESLDVFVRLSNGKARGEGAPEFFPSRPAQRRGHPPEHVPQCQAQGTQRAGQNWAWWLARACLPSCHLARNLYVGSTTIFIWVVMRGVLIWLMSFELCDESDDYWFSWLVLNYVMRVMVTDLVD